MVVAVHLNGNATLGVIDPENLPEIELAGSVLALVEVACAFIAFRSATRRNGAAF